MPRINAKYIAKNAVFNAALGAASMEIADTSGVDYAQLRREATINYADPHASTYAQMLRRIDACYEHNPAGARILRADFNAHCAEREVLMELSPQLHSPCVKRLRKELREAIDACTDGATAEVKRLAILEAIAELQTMLSGAETEINAEAAKIKSYAKDVN